jgi:hypothetical protein
MHTGFRIWFRAVVLNIVWWKAIAVGAIAYIFHVQRFGAYWIERIAFVLAFVAICVWIEVLPSGPEMRSFIKQVLESVRLGLYR